MKASVRACRTGNALSAALVGTSSSARPASLSWLAMPCRIITRPGSVKASVSREVSTTAIVPVLLRRSDCAAGSGPG